MTRAPKRRTEREAFEAWLRRHGIRTSKWKSPSWDGVTGLPIEYHDPAASLAWLAWQARARRGKK